MCRVAGSPAIFAALSGVLPAKHFGSATDSCGLWENGSLLLGAASPSETTAPAKFSTAESVDRSGKVALRYQKQFLVTHDQNWFAFGECGSPVVDTDLGRFGLLICFDGRIPEIARSLAQKGAEVLVDMASFFAVDQAEMGAGASL